MAGRNTILTPEVQERICQALKAGNTRRASALFAGIAESTFYLWMDKANKAINADEERENDVLYVEFMEAVARAEADCEVWHVANVRKQAEDDARLSLEWLARRKPKDWSPHQRTDVTSGGQTLKQLIIDRGKSD